MMKDAQTPAARPRAAFKHGVRHDTRRSNSTPSISTGEPAVSIR
jgi:hypothetical protein